MRLNRLASQITKCSQAGDRTPVLVTPHEFSLRPGFFIDLIQQIKQIGAFPLDETSLVYRPGIQIDCYQSIGGVTSIWSDWRSKRRCASLRRHIGLASLRSGHEVAAEVHWTAMIRRPIAGGPVVIACCDHRQPLPPWALPLMMGSRLPLAA